MFGSNFARRAVFPTLARKFSGHSAEQAKAEAIRWYHLSLGMIALSSLVAVYNVMYHEHEHPRTDLPYQKIRNRPYPWICSDCNIFDYPCWKECRDALKGKVSEGSSHH